MSKLYTEEEIRKILNSPMGEAETVDEFISKLTPIELPTDEEIDEKFNDFLQKELEIGISDKATIERIEWYYNTYFKRHKIKGS